MYRPRSSPFKGRKSNKQEKKVKYQSTELNAVDLTSSEMLVVADEEGMIKIIIIIQCHQKKKKKKEENCRWEGNGSGGGEVRQGGIDLLPLYRGTRQVLSALLLPSLIYCFPPSKVGLLPDLFDRGETARQSSPVSRLGLSPPQAPRSIFSLIFDFPQTKFIPILAPLGLHQCLAR